ncbi:hypothetical protein [Virgibacillus sp. DJP39]|uniref:hypothetical protein n=1 Tax=Virgibacillus sp. DJP39 TaxID=3409790 RepID=UPI003BB6A869
MITQDSHPEYKYPTASLLWSLALPGFGQFYNGQILLGTILLFTELLANILSGLNLSIFETFHGNFKNSHDVMNYQWGMFYPSIWGFSMWQAYNYAIAGNQQIKGKRSKAYLTGFFFGGVVGMNFGIYWHVSFLYSLKLFHFLESPICLGLILGIVCAFLGHWFEKTLHRILLAHRVETAEKGSNFN